VPKVRVTTHANLALIKYWGKRDTTLILPTKNSLGITLEALKTTTSLELNASQTDLITLDDTAVLTKNNPIQSFLDTTRALLGINNRFSITSKNNFPTASGLASSASGFAALALGLNRLCNLQLSMQEISILARLGSGSAARSVHGGFVLWSRGEQSDGRDSFATQIFDATWWPELRVVIAVTTIAAKKTSSRDGMQRSMTSSPHYAAWIAQSENRITAITRAIQQRNIALVGQLAQEDWYGMRDVMLSSQPTLDYWSDTSLAVIKKIAELRQHSGIPAYITTDAGPHVKIICLANDVPTIKQTLIGTPGLVSVIESRVTGDPTVDII
jgi:diphosphomevalonate decarboxylase